MSEESVTPPAVFSGQVTSVGECFTTPREEIAEETVSRLMAESRQQPTARRTLTTASQES